MRTADSVWRELIQDVRYNGLDVRPRGLLCKEVMSKTTRVDMSYPIVTGRPRLGYKFLAAEAWWILTGRNDLDSIRQYSPHIATFSNDGIRFDGSYGPKIMDQLRYVCDTLDTDIESRQAVIEIWRPNPRPSKDVPCTISVQWMIRDQKLHCFDTMRSSDAWLGWPYDVFNFSMLSAYIVLLLRDRAKSRHSLLHSIAPQKSPLTDLQLGTLYLTAASQHLYVNPKEDGANNVPYSLEDVTEVIKNAQGLKPYKPLDLSEFNCAGELITHLELCKDLAGKKSWMSEFQK